MIQKTSCGIFHINGLAFDSIVIKAIDKLLYRHLVHFSLLMISSIRNKLPWYWKISTIVSNNVTDVMLTVTLSIKRIAAVLKTCMTTLSRGALQNSDNCCLDINCTLTNWRVSLSKICHEWPNNTVTHECAQRMSELQRYLVMSDIVLIMKLVN